MKKTLFAIAAILITAMASAQQSQPIPVDENVRIGHLDNGITYYIRHHQEPAGQANFYIAQKVGSILENEDQRGLAHFLEHMCFNGTEHFPGNGVIRYCESIGVKFGANLNAYTSIDETVYNIDNVPVEKVPSAIDSCLWILHDWADGLLLTDEDIDHERGVIHEEWRTRSNAQIRLLEKILPVIYPNNRYGERMPIGLMEVVDNFPYKVLRDYYEKWYRPDQQGIVVVGDIDVDAVEAKIRDIFGTIAKPENPAERFYVQIEDNAEPIVCLAKDKEQPYALSYIFCKHDPYPVEMRGEMSYAVYKYALWAAQLMVNARIQEMLQSPEPPFIQAAIGDEEFLIAKTKYGWGGQVVSSETDLSKAVTALYREMLRAARCGFTASEYERAKAELISSAESEFNSRDKKKSSTYCREYVRHFIDNEPIAGEQNTLAFVQQFTSLIPVEAVNQIVKSLVQDGNLVMFSMLPDKEGVTYPTEEEMTAMLKAVAAEDIAPYVDAVSNEPLMAQLPAAGKIVKTQEAPLGYTLFKLSNGAQVYYKQTDFNPDEIIMSATSKGGKSLYPESENVSLKVINDVMSLGGVGGFNTSELRKVLAGKNVYVSTSVGMFSEDMSARSTPKDIETMFQLNYLYFTAIRTDNDAFESWKVREKAAVANRESDPMNAFQDSLKLTIYSTGAKRLESLSSADIDAVDYNRVLDIAKERFSNAGDFTFFITGAVDQQTIRPLIEQYIASLPATKKREKADTNVIDFAKGQNIKVFDRQMEVPMATILFFDYAKGQYNLKNKLSFDLALNALSVVLLEEIREKEGGTYSIGAYGTLDCNPYPRVEEYMQIIYQTNPDRYEDLNGKIQAIVADFAKNGPSEENLAKGKEYMLKKFNENIRENYFWANNLEKLVETGVDMTSGYEATLKRITVEDVRDIFAGMLKQGNHAETIMVGKK